MNFRECLTMGCTGLALFLPPLASAQAPPVIRSFTLGEASVFEGGRGTFFYDVTGATTLEIDQGVGAVDGVATRFSQTERGYILPLGTTWKFLADGSDQGASDVVAGHPAYGVTNWKHPEFADTTWPSGQAELGYGDNPMTDVGFVDVDAEKDGDQKNATTYYRTQFDVGSADLAALGSLFLEIRRDDSALIYINGVEVSRMNAGDGVLSFDSYTGELGHGATAGGEETTFFVCDLSPAVLRVGSNTIAVEIHQTSETSTDTRFDLGLYQQVAVAGSPVFPMGSAWSFLDDGSNLGDAAITVGEPGYDESNWKHPDFGEGGWRTGVGDFGYDDAVLSEATVLRFGPNEDNADNDPDNKFITSYFRSTFDITDATELASIVGVAAGVRADDGVIVYINGVEAFRDGVDVGEVTSTTPANPAVAVGGGVSETNYDASVIDPAVLVLGKNTIAVELHQFGPTSSDISFDLELDVDFGGGDLLRKIARGSSWMYLDDGGVSLVDTSSNLVAGNPSYDVSNWKHPNFDDVAWRQGEGELGYGDTSLTMGGHLRDTFATGIGFGNDRYDKFVTTYFRKQFSVDGAALLEALGARVSTRADDGLIVYLNGVEIRRANLPANPDPDAPGPDDPVDGTTLASRSASGDGRGFIATDFDKNLLTGGVNTIAVELHQSAPMTSDALFDLSMELVGESSPALTYTLTASNEFGSSTASVTATTTPVPALPVYLTTSNGAGIHWNFPEVWSDKLAPHATDYIAYGQLDSTVRSPDGTDDPVFGGTSLELRAASAQLVLSHRSGTAIIPNLVLDGGRIVNGTVADLAVGGLGNSIVVSSDSIIGTLTNSGELTVSGDLVGSGALLVPNPGGDSPAATIFTGDNRGYTGDWLIQGIFAPAHAGAFGSGAIIVLDGGVLDPRIDYLSLLPNSLALSDEATLELGRTIAFVSGAVTIAGNQVADGAYTAAQLDALGYGGVFVDGGGRLFVGAIVPDTDGDGLLDSWELTYFENIGVTDGRGDADGDGQTDGAEFDSATVPTDPLDVFKITSAVQGLAGEVTLSWESKADITYGVRFGDLSTWTVIATSLAGNGMEMSFTDDGTLTGGAPGDDAERHYQVFVE